MISKMHEMEGAFYIEFNPENQEEGQALIRFGLNATKERVLFGAAMGRRSGPTAWISLSKRKQEIFSIKA